MFLQLQQESLLIGKRPSGFTEHYYTEWDDGLDKEKIALFMVMSVGSTQVPGAEIGREAFQLLQDHFLHDLSGDPYDRFESALREVNLMVNEKEKELDLKFIPNINIVCGVIQKDLLFLSQRGEARGYLVRKRHVSSITDELYDERNKEDLFQNIASGVLDVGDTVVFTTGHLVQYVTPNDLSKIFSEQSLSEAGKELKDLLHMDMEDQLALLSFEVLEKTEAVEPEPVPVQQAAIEEAPVERVPSVAQEQMKKNLKVLRDWATHEDRWLFLRRLRAMESRKLLQVLAGLVLVLAIGFFFLTREGGSKAELEDMNTKLATAEDYVAQAATTGTFNKTEAQNLLDDAEVLVVEILDSGHLPGQASSLLDEIQEQRDFLDNVTHLDEEVTLLVDFSDEIGNASLRGVASYEGKHVVFTASEIYEVLIDEAQSPTTVESSEPLLAADFFDDRNNVVMVLADGSVVEYAGSNVQFADTSDVEWQPGSTAVATYSSRIYLLDPAEGQIWKYQRGGSGYGAASAYLDSSTVDVSAAVDLAIDGSVWVLQDSGEITQLLSGEEVDFDIDEAPSGSLEGATKIWTSLDVNRVYVLDPAEQRLLSFIKDSRTSDLAYERQYIFDTVKGTVVDFYYDNDRDVIILVTDQALYEVDL